MSVLEEEPQPPSGRMHVVPVFDLVEHETVDCMCGPTVEVVRRGDGSFGWLVQHHSLDGREFSGG